LFRLLRDISQGPQHLTGAKEVLMGSSQRITRDYRKPTPSKFLHFIQKVKRGLTDNANYPESAWGANIGVLRRFFEDVVIVEGACHVASRGDRDLIRQRDKLIAEMVLVLDELASLLEAMSVRNPDALFTTGFNISKERRSTPRVKVALVAPTDFVVENLGEPRKALGKVSTVPGAYNHEVHVNRRDPSVEQDWNHQALYPDSGNMVMENLEPGNTFFRVRPHGPDGAGPWSAVVTVTIT
jgi:hypothetical protein